MAGHTPGPWVVRIDSQVNWPRVAGAVKSNDKRDVVASFPISGNRETVLINARLIAAAPELLEACKVFLSRMDDAQGSDAYHLELEAIIAKAEGAK